MRRAAYLGILALAACGSGGGPAIELRVAADAPGSGDGAALPGAWVLVVPEGRAPADGERLDVAQARRDGAELLRTDDDGRARPEAVRGPVLVCELGTSGAPAAVAGARSCVRAELGTRGTLVLTLGEAGLRPA